MDIKKFKEKCEIARALAFEDKMQYVVARSTRMMEVLSIRDLPSWLEMKAQQRPHILYITPPEL